MIGQVLGWMSSELSTCQARGAFAQELYWYTLNSAHRSKNRFFISVRTKIGARLSCWVEWKRRPPDDKKKGEKRESFFAQPSILLSFVLKLNYLGILSPWLLKQKYVLIHTLSPPPFLYSSEPANLINQSFAFFGFCRESSFLCPLRSFFDISNSSTIALLLLISCLIGTTR